MQVTSNITRNPMKRLFMFLILSIFTLSLNAQNKPSYPEPTEGFKRVDLLLPKNDNSKDYKVQVKFSFEASLIECSNADFSFNRKNLKEEYGIPQNSRYPYYVLESDAAEIFEGMQSDCKSDKKVMRKILSSQDIFIDYQSCYARPFYIPESWSVEYRIWKAENKYNTVNN
jgi:ecotin